MKAITMLAVAMAVAAGLASGGAEAADAAAGEKVFNRCKACHDATKGGPHRVGPNLFGVVGRKCGSTDFPRYSAGMKACAEAGGVWDETTLPNYIPDAAKYLEKTHGKRGQGMIPQMMSEADMANLVAYLRTLK